MRDPLAPVIEGYDFAGIVNRYSFQCDPFYVEGDNGGTLLDGSTVTDVLAAKVRLSWVLNSVSSAQYAALNAALNSGPSPDTVNAYVFDPTANALRLAKFHVTRPAFQFAFDTDAGQIMSYPGGELILEEALPVARFAITPPSKTRYAPGDALDLSGLAVTRYDNDGSPSDITAQCSTIPADGTPLANPVAVPVSVSFAVSPDVNVIIGGFVVTVAEPEPVDGDDWWTLYDNGTLEIYRLGPMPDYSQFDYLHTNPWYAYRNQIITVKLRDGVTSIGAFAFDSHENLVDIEIPDSVVYIGEGAFLRAESLRKGIIPDGVTTIQQLTFWNAGISSVTIPSSVKTIQRNNFDGRYTLKDVYFGGTEEQWNAIFFASNGEGNARIIIPDRYGVTIHYNSSGPT